MNKVIFIDRDGVINTFPGYGYYVTSWEEFSFLPQTIKALKLLYDAGYQLHVISNQAGVGKGLYTDESLDELTAAMCAELKAAGIELAGVHYCIHHPDEGCHCRKPNIGLFHQAVGEEHDFNATYYIGDALTDIQAGVALGARTILVLSGRAKKEDIDEWAVKPDHIVADLLEAARLILHNQSFC